jgi:hypothetical protein
MGSYPFLDLAHLLWLDGETMLCAGPCKELRERRMRIEDGPTRIEEDDLYRHRSSP